MSKGEIKLRKRMTPVYICGQLRETIRLGGALLGTDVWLPSPGTGHFLKLNREFSCPD
jgi:hypothetical protein